MSASLADSADKRLAWRMGVWDRLAACLPSQAGSPIFDCLTLLKLTIDQHYLAKLRGRKNSCRDKAEQRHPNLSTLRAYISQFHEKRFQKFPIAQLQVHLCETPHNWAKKECKQLFLIRCRKQTASHLFLA